MTSIVVTGATGFIGQALIAALKRKQCGDIYGLSHDDADLFDRSAVRTVMRRLKPTHLIHLAWCTQPHTFWADPENERWAECSEALVRTFVDYGGSVVVGAGSCAEYFASDTPYARAKARLWGAIATQAERSGIRASWGRVFYVYGPGEARERLLSSVLLRLAHGEAVAVREPRRRLDYIYVGDVAHAFVTLALQSMTGAHDIGTGVPVTVRELVRKTADVAGFDPACVVEDEIQSPGPDVIADPKSLQTAGWSAEIDLTGGIRSLWNTLRSGNQ